MHRLFTTLSHSLVTAGYQGCNLSQAVFLLVIVLADAGLNITGLLLAWSKLLRGHYSV
jgi:hypothetical protein